MSVDINTDPRIKVASQVADALVSSGYSEDQASFIFDKLADILKYSSKKELFSLLVLKNFRED